VGAKKLHHPEANLMTYADPNRIRYANQQMMAFQQLRSYLIMVPLSPSNSVIPIVLESYIGGIDPVW
jgi:hypothetical protein